jgi:hypothetical protein
MLAFAFIPMLSGGQHVLVKLQGNRHYATPDSKTWKDTDEDRLEE